MRVLIQQGSGETGKRVSLDENEAHHLRVRRAREREQVEVLDGAGLRATGRLARMGKQWAVDIETARQEPHPPQLSLAVAAGDRERFFWMVEKSVELGVTRIVPLVTAYSSTVATGIKTTHIPRLRRHALESSKQCGAAWMLRLEDPLPLDDFLRRPLAGFGWLADRSGVSPPATLDSGALSVVIGPEGGLTSGERDAALAAGYRPTVLGPYTLRFESAAIAAAALVTAARMRGISG
jgi:16S rRNA (uracil1498-N3)-methyltransferase